MHALEAITLQHLSNGERRELRSLQSRHADYGDEIPEVLRDIFYIGEA